MASKVQERILVENFLSRLGSDYVIAEEREAPDFVIARGSQQFGLEVVQVFRDRSLTGSPTKAMESRRVQYLKRLAFKYYSCGGLPLLVKVSGLPDVDMATVVDRLKAERSRKPWGEGHFRLRRSTFYLRTLPAEFESYSRWVCINNSVGWSGFLTSDDIEPLISDKASKLSKYRKAIDRVELLLVVNTVSISGMVRWCHGNQAPANQGFDAVHLYFHPGKLIRLG